MWEYLIYITAEQSFGAAPPFSMPYGYRACIMSARKPLWDPMRQSSRRRGMILLLIDRANDYLTETSR